MAADIFLSLLAVIVFNFGLKDRAFDCSRVLVVYTSRLNIISQKQDQYLWHHDTSLKRELERQGTFSALCMNF